MFNIIKNQGNKTNTKLEKLHEQKKNVAGQWWLMSVILATQDSEIRRITF
jgi:hypothetical protein